MGGFRCNGFCSRERLRTELIRMRPIFSTPDVIECETDVAGQARLVLPSS